MIMRGAMQGGLHEPHNFTFTVVITEGVPGHEIYTK
jgi:hypothetical protein